MANSMIVYTGDGSSTGPYVINFTLGFISRDDVTCRVGDEAEDREIEWINDGSVNIAGDPPGVDVRVVFKRTVDKTQLIHDYENDADIEESNLDESNKQALMAVHEVLDGRLENISQDLDMKTYKIINLGDGVEATDAVNKGQLDAVIEDAAEAAAEAAEEFADDAEASATAAATSATNAATSATNAATSATNAANSATAAASARDSALAAYDNFDDRYLGPKASDPTLDNDGTALIAGALYFNTVSETIKIYTGSVWVNAYSDGNTFLAKENNLSDLLNAGTARTNLGLGSVLSDISTLQTDLNTAEADILTKAAAGANNDITSLNAYEAPFGGFRNALLNGALDVWQRNTSFSSIANNTYAADMFSYHKSGAMVHDVSKSSDVPSLAQAGVLLENSILVDCTTVDSSIASSDFCILRQNIEGYNWRFFAQRALTLSFWVKATKTGIHCVAFKNSTADRSLVLEYTVNVADTWEKKTLSIPASPSAGTWNYTTGVGVQLDFVLASGTDFQTTAGSWQSGLFVATANQVNACDNTNNNFRLAAIQLEIGSVATKFEVRPFIFEVELCKRYYEKTFPYATVPAQAAAFDGCIGVGPCPASTGAGLAVARWTYSVPKRIAATITTFAPGISNSGFRDASGNNVPVTVDFNGDRGVAFYNTNTLAASATRLDIHAVADASF
jgi:hypothetical protein